MIPPCFDSPCCSRFLFPRNPLLVISIDGMRPDYVLKADEHGLKIPHLRRILKDGAHATGVRGVLPTVTYPSHTTILTGVWPVKHHIYSNVLFDPLDRNLAGWMWYAEDIAVPTLWQAASKAGLVVGSVSWPVSVAAPGITYDVPEYWRAPKMPGEDIKLLRAISTPGLIAEIEKQAGPYVTDLDDAATRRPPAHPLRRRDSEEQTRAVHDRASGLARSSGAWLRSIQSGSQRDARTDRSGGRRAGSTPRPAPSSASSPTTASPAPITLSTSWQPFAEEGLVTMTNKKVTAWKAFPDLEGRLRGHHFERSER